MKKWLLSIFVIFMFASYVFYQRADTSKELNVSQPNSDSDEKIGENSSPPTGAPPSTPTSPAQNQAQAKTQVPTPTPDPISVTPPAPKTVSQYKDGSYPGKVVPTIFGDVQVGAVIKSGKLSDVTFLKFPNDRETSINISKSSLAVMKSEAITIQSAKVNVVSGATQTWEGFVESLDQALVKAKS